MTPRLLVGGPFDGTIRDIDESAPPRYRVHTPREFNFASYAADDLPQIQTGTYVRVHIRVMHPDYWSGWHGQAWIPQWVLDRLTLVDDYLYEYQETV